MPAADISEQISTAGFEASGTGNMKLTMNGALTVGTLDGANVEILDAVGKENFYLFGLTSEEVLAAHQNNTHRPLDFYNNDPRIKRVMDSLVDGTWTLDEDKNLFMDIFQNIMFQDYYLVLADFDSYVSIQETIGRDFNNRRLWAKKSLLNIAHSGYFSIDRTVDDYAKDIWHMRPIVED